jgi:hypothetical protein
MSQKIKDDRYRDPMFPMIFVRLTIAEYEKLRKEGVITSEGTARAALRKRAGLPEVPQGWKKRKKQFDQQYNNMGGYTRG